MQTNLQNENSNANRIHISTNGYYGYQSLSQKECNDDEQPIYMDVQMCDSGVQFNNFINPEDRLIVQEVTRGIENRKRRFCFEDVATPDSKKLREMDIIRSASYELKYERMLDKKNKSIDHLLEQLLQETHGCSTYHWMQDSH